jgi:hypothetical protein
MTEQVVSLDLGLTWEPNAPDAVLLAPDNEDARLAMRPHPNDPDRSMIVLRWVGTVRASLSAPNDEARHHHRLYGAGLRDLLWAGEVLDSEWTHELLAYDRPVSGNALRSATQGVHRRSRRGIVRS